MVDGTWEVRAVGKWNGRKGARENASERRVPSVPRPIRVEIVRKLSLNPRLFGTRGGVLLRPEPSGDGYTNNVISRVNTYGLNRDMRIYASTTGGVCAGDGDQTSLLRHRKTIILWLLLLFTHVAGRTLHAAAMYGNTRASVCLLKRPRKTKRPTRKRLRHDLLPRTA